MFVGSWNLNTKFKHFYYMEGKMSKSRFENLEINNLSERLADLIWELVINWEYFAKNTIGDK